MKALFINLALAWILAAAPALAGPPMALVELAVGPALLKVELPHTWPQRFQGLSGRPGLGPSQGMAFFELPASRVVMTMRGMRFGLDFLWCRRGKVIQINPKVRPLGRGRPWLSPRQPVDLVIEAPAGWARAHGVQSGDQVKALKVLRKVDSPTLRQFLRVYRP